MSAVFSPPPAALPTDKELVLKVIPMPADTNGNGDIFGGWVMAQVDLAGSVLPARYIQGRINGSLPAMPVLVPETLLHTRLELESLSTHAASVGVRNVRTPARATELATWGADLLMGATLEVLAAVPSAPSA